MIQFDLPNHVQKTNQKNLQISAGKHPFDTFKVHKVCQLLGLKSQTSEHGAECRFITSDLRAIDVELIPQRCGSQRWHVTDHIGVAEDEKLQLREILQGWNVAGDLGVQEAEVCQLREILQCCNVTNHMGLVEVEIRQLREILQSRQVTRDLGLSELEDLQVWQFAEARTQGAGDLLDQLQIHLHHFAVLPRLRDPRPDVVEGPHASRLCWQISVASFVMSEKFCVSILVSSQKSGTAKNHAKTIERVATLQKSLHVTTL